MFVSWLDDMGNGAEPHEIMPSLYLGSSAAARNRARLNELNISHILTAARAIVPKFRGDFQYMLLDVDDWAGEDMLHYFEATNKFIDEARQHGRVLVHCMAGVSRSATVTIAYVMYSMKIAFEPAYALVKKARSCISPNPGFLRQLQVYERWCFGVKTPRYRLPQNTMVCSLRESNDSNLSSSGADNDADEVADWETNMCTLLFKLEFIAKAEKSFTFSVSSSGLDPADVLHEKNFRRYTKRPPKPEPKFLQLGDTDEGGEGLSSDILGKFVTLNMNDQREDESLEYEELWVDKKPADASLSSHMVYVWICKGCDKYLFTPLNVLYLANFYYEVEVMSWMKGIGTVTGTLECPKCRAVLGDFDWQGMKNESGVSVPVFRIMKKNVEKKEVEIFL